jgi:hypothetical protein
MFALAESDTGYVWRFVFDLGSRTVMTGKPKPGNLLKPGQIVWTLMAGHMGQKLILDEGRFLAADNFYTDIHLFFALSQSETDCIRTVRSNHRDLPESVLKNETLGLLDFEQGIFN